MQRLGRKGYPTYRIVVQDRRQAPNSGKVIEYLGNYNPHTKEINLNKDLIDKFLKNGAHPSTSAASLFKKEGIKLPKWVKLAKNDAKKSLKNPEKLRKNRPAEEPKVEEPKAEEPAPDQPKEEAPVAEANEDATPETAEEKAEDSPEEEPTPEEAKE